MFLSIGWLFVVFASLNRNRKFGTISFRWEAFDIRKKKKKTSTMNTTLKSHSGIDLARTLIHSENIEHALIQVFSFNVIYFVICSPLLDLFCVECLSHWKYVNVNEMKWCTNHTRSKATNKKCVPFRMNSTTKTILLQAISYSKMKLHNWELLTNRIVSALTKLWKWPEHAIRICTFQRGAKIYFCRQQPIKKQL